MLALIVAAFAWWGYRRTLSLIRAIPHTRELCDVGEATVQIGEDGIVQNANPAAVMLFGYKLGELVGENVKLLMPEPYHSAHDGYIAAYLKTGEKRIIGVGRDLIGRKKDGTLFPLRLTISEIWDASGEHRVFVGTCRDISTQKWAELQRVAGGENAVSVSAPGG